LKNCLYRYCLIGIAILFIGSPKIWPHEHPGFYVEGRYLYDPCGEKVILRGVSNPNIWFERDGLLRYREIEKTGANVVRIVWNTTGTADELDTAVTNCINLGMIPMVELHDATGNWNKLQFCVNYWTREDIADVIIKNEKYLLLNIANECGNYFVTLNAFKTGYESAIMKIREAKIHVPLVIDGTDWGKNINILQSQGPYLIEADPDHNLIFSVHMWWPKMYGFSESNIEKEIKQSVEMDLPLIVGEFSQMHGSCDDDKITPNNAIPYRTIIKQCYLYEIGWIAWSWFGNCNPLWDMTSDGTYDQLYDWGLEVAVTDSYSIQNTSVRPYSITHGSCQPAVVENLVNMIPPSSSILSQNFPNPFNSNTQIHYAVADPAHVTLAIIDMQGNEVKILVNSAISPGSYTIQWDGQNDGGEVVANGTYLYLMTVRQNGDIFKKVKKLILLK